MAKVNRMTSDECRIVTEARLQGRAGGFENSAEHLTWFICPVCNEPTLIAVHPKDKAHVNTCGMMSCMKAWREVA